MNYLRNKLTYVGIGGKFVYKLTVLYFLYDISYISVKELHAWATVVLTSA